MPALLSCLLFGACSAPVDPPAVVPDAAVDSCTARYSVARRRREVIVVLDRSCAMRARFDGTIGSGPTDAESRWGAVGAALVAASADVSIAGWALAPAPEAAASCDVGALAVSPSLGNAAELTAALTATDPFALCPDGTGEVPLEGALSAVLASDQVGTTGDPMVVVIAAGVPSCGATVESLSALGTSFRDVVVLALAPDAAATPLLEAIGEVRTVASADAVAGAIDAAIDEHDARCVLELDGALAADPEQLRVWVDGTPIAADPDEGWSYGADMAIALNGALCEALTSGAIARVDAALGCDERRCVATHEACDSLDNDCDDTVDEECS